MLTDPACEITPLVLTFDEAPNIGRTLAQLTWAKRVIIVDSHSTDDTLRIVERFPNAQVYKRAFDDHSSQWNYGLDRVDSTWTLALDADYFVPASTSEEIRRSISTSSIEGYYARLSYCVRGHVLRHAILPPRLVLFRTAAGRYFQDGHTQELKLDGRTQTLTNPIWHDDRKSLRRWLWAQDRYSDLEVRKLLTTPTAELPLRDRIRKTALVAPWLVPIYYLLAKGGLRDGWAGLDYAAQRAIAELVLSVKLIEHLRLHSVRDDADDS